MKISVVTVCYNAVDTLEETMLSVLNQTYPDVEYIVIDGGSIDGTVDIIKKYANRLAYRVSEPDKGIYDAMNKGIDVATGDYINFMNAGDSFINNNIISEIFNDITINNDNEVIYGGSIVKYNESKAIVRHPKPLKEMWKGSCICHQASFIRLDTLKSIKYNTAYKIAADYDYFMNTYNRNINVFLLRPSIICHYSALGCSDKNRISGIQEMRKISLSYHNTKMIKLYFSWRIMIEKIKIQIKRMIKWH